MARSGLLSGEIQNPPSSFILPQLFGTYPAGYCGYDLWEDDVSFFDEDNNNEYLEDILADEIITYLDTYDAQNDDPFFIYWAMLTPHVPFSQPPETSTVCNLMYNTNTPQEQERKAECNAMYYADKLIGDVVQKLKDENIYDDTVIIFTSDNGIYLYI